MTRLFRATNATRPHLGRFSFWTPSEGAARSFAEWAVNEPCHPMTDPRLYCADVELTATTAHDFGVASWPSREALAEARRMVDRGTPFSWACFIGTVAFNGERPTEFIYLGKDPLPVEEVPL